MEADTIAEIFLSVPWFEVLVWIVVVFLGLCALLSVLLIGSLTIDPNWRRFRGKSSPASGVSGCLLIPATALLLGLSLGIDLLVSPGLSLPGTVMAWTAVTLAAWALVALVLGAFLGVLATSKNRQ